ncbi:MAG: hypothetical protein EXR62_17480 [Chloroflexi bacterium]|nr:hypothetical protein [Chloroflexota bacterium]
MSENEETTLTHHAMLVAWGQYAHGIGLVEGLAAIPLHQKTRVHQPQTKVIEFLVAILGGLSYLKDISLSAHPLDQDAVVARAWGQAGWADHSGVSRTLQELTMAETQQIIAVLEQVSQPVLDKEVLLAASAGRLELDGDLSPRAVSETSTTYPDAAFGYMGGSVGLGYQAAVVSLRSPTYGRIGLSVAHHPGSTVSCTQATALVYEAERRIGSRPLRRTDLLAQRVQHMEPQGSHLQAKVDQAQQALGQVQTELALIDQQLAAAQQQVQGLQVAYTQRQRPERPHSHLAKARQQWEMYQRRQGRRSKAVTQAQLWLERQQAHLVAHTAEITALSARLAYFAQENATNAAPIRITIRLDAGFGTPENLALLIELGYEVYTKPYGTWLSGWLKAQSAQTNAWMRVGHNAEMLAWKAIQLDDFPYPLDLAQERFSTGDGYRETGLIHFGPDDVLLDLGRWFRHYNARQIIEAGHKEAKQVFEIHHLKVRGRCALLLQEQMTLFAALWLAQCCPQIPDGWKESTHPQVKQQVKVGAQTSAWVSWQGQDCLLRFTDHSVFAGRSLSVVRQLAFQPVLPMTKSCYFSST